MATLRDPAQPLALAEISESDAHFVRRVDARGQGKIYTSPTATFDGSKAICRGLLVCFPHFSSFGPLLKQNG